MVERLEAAAETGAEYYMVTVSESVTFSYPALATDAEAAREKVAALIGARPRSARPGRGAVPPRGNRGRGCRGVRGPEL